MLKYSYLEVNSQSYIKVNSERPKSYEVCQIITFPVIFLSLCEYCLADCIR